MLHPSLATSSLSLGPALEVPVPPTPTNRLDILEYFDNVFLDTTATQPHEIAEAFRLRYQVYCLDRGFEEAAACPEGMERDRYDAYASHSLLTDRLSKQTLGTVRLVKPVKSPNWVAELPLADYAHADSIARLMSLPAGSTAEVSRFAIARSARSLLRLLPAAVAQLDTAAPQLKLREKLLPYMSLGLIRGLVRLSIRHGVTHWCLAAEPSLLRRLRAFGLHFENCGPLVDHRGLRQVCFAELGALLERAEADRPEFWSIITHGGRLAPIGLAKSAA